MGRDPRAGRNWQFSENYPAKTKEKTLNEIAKAWIVRMLSYQTRW